MKAATSRSRPRGRQLLRAAGTATRASMLTVGLAGLAIGLGGLLWIRGQHMGGNLMALAVGVLIVLPALLVGVVLTGTVMVGVIVERVNTLFPKPWGTRERAACDEDEGDAPPRGDRGVKKGPLGVSSS